MMGHVVVQLIQTLRYNPEEVAGSIADEIHGIFRQLNASELPSSNLGLLSDIYDCDFA
jgi:hypothetical protein